MDENIWNKCIKEKIYITALGFSCRTGLNSP